MEDPASDLKAIYCCVYVIIVTLSLSFSFGRSVEPISIISGELVE